MRVCSVLPADVSSLCKPAFEFSTSTVIHAARVGRFISLDGVTAPAVARGLL